MNIYSIHQFVQRMYKYVDDWNILYFILFCCQMLTVYWERESLDILHVCLCIRFTWTVWQLWFTGFDVSDLMKWPVSNGVLIRWRSMLKWFFINSFALTLDYVCIYSYSSVIHSILEEILYTFQFRRNWDTNWFNLNYNS